MLVLPTDWSPKKTSLYLAKGDTDAISFITILISSLSLFLSFFFCFFLNENENEEKREKEEEKQMKQKRVSLNPLFYIGARKNRQLWRATLKLFVHLFYPLFKNISSTILTQLLLLN